MVHLSAAFFKVYSANHKCSTRHNTIGELNLDHSQVLQSFLLQVPVYCFPACDYLGERMASFFGITSAKYQYAIDEYYRMKKEVR